MVPSVFGRSWVYGFVAPLAIFQYNILFLLVLRSSIKLLDIYTSPVVATDTVDPLSPASTPVATPKILSRSSGNTELFTFPVPLSKETSWPT